MFGRDLSRPTRVWEHLPSQTRVGGAGRAFYWKVGVRATPPRELRGPPPSPQAADIGRTVFAPPLHYGICDDIGLGSMAIAVATLMVMATWSFRRLRQLLWQLGHSRGHDKGYRNFDILLRRGNIVIAAALTMQLL